MDNLHISMAAEPIFYVGPVPITNAMILGAMGVVVMLSILFYAANALKKGKRNFFLGLIQWNVEGFLGQAEEIIGDKKSARRIFPLAMTIFFTVLMTYWVAALPGVGVITYNDVPIFRGLPADLNFTLGLAIITIVTAQIYAVRKHGLFGNIGRYLKNPIKDPIGAFEGILEFVGEFSRMVALCLRLFGNAFAGEILLLIILLLTSYGAIVALPLVMVFEIFIGFIQAYVFFVLTLIFTSLATQDHGAHEEPALTSIDHSPATADKTAVADS